jgi:DNA-binding response OmpR family regulator
MKTLLLVTDDPEPERALPDELESAGYQVISAQDGKTALNLLQHELPDLVLLNLALPEMDGAELCRQLRQTCDVPILVLTTRLEEAERVTERERCADDYVLSPFPPHQVMARVRALLRWAESRDAVGSDVIRAGDLELNPAYHRAMVAGEPVDLTRTELTLLATLAATPGRVCTRSQLMGALTGNRCLSQRTIDSHIKNLRDKIEPDPHHPRYILTIYGVGYKLKG